MDRTPLYTTCVILMALYAQGQPYFISDVPSGSAGVHGVCTLAAPPIQDDGVTIQLSAKDIGQVSIKKGFKLWTDYVETLVDFIYIGCSETIPTEKKHLKYKDIGRCYSLCKTEYLGMSDKDCFCLESLNFTITSDKCDKTCDSPKDSDLSVKGIVSEMDKDCFCLESLNFNVTSDKCDKACDSPKETLCGKEDKKKAMAISIYKKAVFSVSNSAADSTAACLSLQLPGHIYTWATCTTHHAYLCQDERYDRTNIAYTIANDKTKWREGMKDCSIHDLYPAVYREDKIENTHAIYWVGGIRAFVATTTSSDTVLGGAGLRQSYIEYDKDAFELHFKDQGDTNESFPALCTTVPDTTTETQTTTTTSTDVINSTESTISTMTTTKINTINTTTDITDTKPTEATTYSADSVTTNKLSATVGKGNSLVAVYVMVPLLLLSAIGVFAFFIIKRQRKYAGRGRGKPAIFDKLVKGVRSGLVGLSNAAYEAREPQTIGGDSTLEFSDDYAAIKDTEAGINATTAYSVDKITPSDNVYNKLEDVDGEYDHINTKQTKHFKWDIYHHMNRTSNSNERESVYDHTNIKQTTHSDLYDHADIGNSLVDGESVYDKTNILGKKSFSVDNIYNNTDIKNKTKDGDSVYDHTNTPGIKSLSLDDVYDHTDVRNNSEDRDSLYDHTHIKEMKSRSNDDVYDRTDIRNRSVDGESVYDKTNILGTKSFSVDDVYNYIDVRNRFEDRDSVYDHTNTLGTKSYSVDYVYNNMDIKEKFKDRDNVQ